MRNFKLFYCLLFAGLVAAPVISRAQVIPPVTESTSAAADGDSLRLVEILSTRKLELLKINDSTQLQILAGGVKLKQNTSYFYCDSCVINNNTKTFEAWGNVHINDADTANIYSNHLRYFILKKLAFLDGGVRLTDGKGTLTTPDLEYDMTTDIGIYKHGGKVLNKKTVLTSREGYYYAGLRDVYFKNNVELKDPAYSIKTDSLLYNTESQTARFIAYTLIKDSSGRTVETREGFYNMQTGKAEFGGRAVIKDGRLTITANNIATDDSTGISHARGNVIIVDSVQHTIIIAGEVYSDNKKDRILATRKPLLIVKQDDDSIFIAADTLFSARLTDLYGSKDSVLKDTVKGTKVVSINNKDSTNRYFEAYRNVRIFSDSLQAAGDSVFYSFKDSVFRLYQDPVVWSKGSQITGDTILLFTKNKKADQLKVFENSFLVNKLEPEVYNQVKSTRMDSYFKDGSIDSVRANGFAECIYYLQDDDSAYTGINESKSDIMDIYFSEQALQKVVLRTNITGTIWPIKEKSPTEMRLTNFRWLEERRPKTKYDLF
ncbi:MAG: OstA family protein [Ferruginibacter sp.]|nr:OstA family protein [Chitinophagaceae bacterium]